MVGVWVRTTDNRIIEVQDETKTMYIGREVNFLDDTTPKLRYGKSVAIDKKDVIKEEYEE